MPRPYLLIALAAIMLAAKAPAQTVGDPLVEVVPRADITLQPLNPLRGDLSPKAGVLWGDIKQDIPTGTLIEFVDGFASPPHIHNITYRGVVISGEVHNDDPEAARLWMGPGSFWTQPAGETHITAAKSGATATAFLEILEGPYLVRPAEEEFDNGERPVNIEVRNVIWLEAADIAWISAAPGSGVEISFLWGSPRPEALNGTFLRLPPGAEGHLQGGQAWLRAVLISGQARHAVEGLSNPVDLDTGSYFGSTGAAMHNLACRSAIACLLYIRTEGRYRFTAF